MNFANLCNFSSINLLIKRSLIIKWSHKNPVKIVTMLSFINRRLSIVIRFSKQVWNIPSYINFVDLFKFKITSEGILKSNTLSKSIISKPKFLHSRLDTAS